MKLSIIIPVYRTQNTLKRCLDSVLSQSFTDYEIILVDDESPDDSPQLCDKYAEKNKRIQVMHKKNGGLSDARNAGIEQAKGEYLTFIDSDDALAENTLQHLVDELETNTQIDILEYPICERIGNPQKEHLLSFTPKEYQQPMDYWFAEQGFQHTYACNKVFKRCLFKHVRFPKGKTFEDTLTIPILLGLVPYNQEENKYLSPIIKVTNRGKYLYYWNDNGISVKIDFHDMENLYEGHILSLKYIFEKLNNNPKLIKKYNISLQKLMANILNAMLYIHQWSGEYMINPPIVTYLKKVSAICPIFPFKLKLLNILGYHRLCKLNHLLHKVYKRH